MKSLKEIQENARKTFEDATSVKFDLASVRYGVFQNLGFKHWRKKETIIRPFATEASKDKRVVSAFKEIQGKMVDVAVQDLIKEQLGKYGVGPKISPNSSTKRYSY